MNSTERDLVERLRATTSLSMTKDGKANEPAIAAYVQEAYAIRHEAADALASIRAELAEARADKARVDELLTAAVDDYDAAVKALRDCAAILPHYRLMGKTLGDDETLDQVLDRARAIAGEQKP